MANKKKLSHNQSDDVTDYELEERDIAMANDKRDIHKTASSALSNQTTRSNNLFDDNNADPASRTGFLQDPSSGKLKRDSEKTSVCDGMLELNKAFKRIDDVMTFCKENGE